MGALEEGGKAIGGVVDAMRSQPLAIALVLMNLGLLTYLYYYTSRITSRTEMTAQALFTANDKLYAQFGTIVKDQNVLVEKAMHCILPEDVVRLQAPPPQRPAAPQRPAPLEEQLLILPKPRPSDAPRSLLFLPPAPPLTDPQVSDPPASQPEEK